MVLVDQAAQKRLLDRYQKHEPRLVSGGSVANSIIAFSQLGGQAAFIGCVGDDRYGLFYANEFEELGIDIGNPIIVNETTGTCVCIITPDAERTMRTCLAVSSHLAARHVDEAAHQELRLAVHRRLRVRQPRDRPDRHSGGGAARQEARHQDRHHLLGRVHPAGLRRRRSAPRCSTPICSSATRREACAITGATTAEEAFEQAERAAVPSAVVTNGPHGAYFGMRGVEAHVPAFPSEPKDLTGAGDMFAGAFLYGITHGVAPETGRPRRRLSGAQGDHAGRRPASSRDQTVLG